MSEPRQVDSATSATPGSRWRAGDKALTKPVNGGHLYIGAEEAERLGLKAGDDGWATAEVVADETLPGSDWIYVEESTEYTPEQARTKIP